MFEKDYSRKGRGFYRPMEIKMYALFISDLDQSRYNQEQIAKIESRLADLKGLTRFLATNVCLFDLAKEAHLLADLQSLSDSVKIQYQVLYLQERPTIFDYREATGLRIQEEYSALQK